MRRRFLSLGTAALALSTMLCGCNVYEASLLASRAGRDPTEPYIGLCGNAAVDANEKCDIRIGPGEEGACPSDCTSEDPCRLVQRVGDDCQRECVGLQITYAATGDGCCPQGVGADRDGDCGSCGDSIVGPNEACDPPEKCPSQAACKSQNTCLTALFTGSAESCTARCSLTEISACEGGDHCCPAGCSSDSDDDCSASCGDGMVEGDAGETCEVGDATSPCPEGCDDADPCTSDVKTGSAENCNAVCSHVPIVRPVQGDGCCPSGVSANTDTDCAPVCGNGIPEAGEDCDGQGYCNSSCDQVLQPSIVHRYRFTGTGTTVTDSIGAGHGMVVGANLSGSGTVVLTGGSGGPYVDLPNGVLSALTNATVEVWLTWGGGDAFQRVFDFGNNNSGENQQGLATSTWFFTPVTTLGSARMLINFTAAADDYSNDFAIDHSTALSTNVPHQVVAVFDDGNDTLRLYVDGALSGSRTGVTGHLSSLDDKNAWIGRSNYNDARLGATVHEVRIYNAALNSTEVTSSYNAGPDP